MKAEHPRAARYPFVASAILTNLDSENKTTETTWDLSLFGCHVVPGNSTPAGTRLRIQIAHKGAVFEALGRVSNVRPIKGIGIVFTNIEQRDQQILDRWMDELRNEKS